jgi:protein-tyrosine phosphatase
MRTVLFLCTGNYYRSRFAEVLFNALAARSDLHWRADSRGLELNSNNIGPMSWAAVERLALLGIDTESCERYPLPVAQADLERADHIVAVKELEHRPLLVRKHPAWVERVDYWHIHDCDCATPDEALPMLEMEVQALVGRLLKQQGDDSPDGACGSGFRS